MASKKDYTKEIIREYNIRLQSWGNSDSWGLTEFKMLEDLIYESSKMRINANTLKRFFQQRTSKPQLATNNALCIFLGYSGYTEFVMKKTSEEQEDEKDEKEPSEQIEAINTEQIEPERTTISEKNKISKEISENNVKKNLVKRHQKQIWLFVGIGIIIFALLFGWDTISRKYKSYLISQITFEASLKKGASPLTVKFEYHIPDQLIDSMYVVFKEANGDITQKKPERDQDAMYMTYIWPGRGSCFLKYGDQIIKTIHIETRTPGWSIYVRDDKRDFFETVPFDEVIREDGYITFPGDKLPSEALTDNLFISYTYYNNGIIDGDNFICEARVRNSNQDHGKRCYDVMMYAFSNTEMHGFSLNENCFSYLKFISGEKTITGDKYDLSNIQFNPADWHVMRIEVIDKQTTFLLDGKKVLNMNYTNSLGKLNEITLRFKGFGAIDYAKIMKPNNEVVYEVDF